MVLSCKVQRKTGSTLFDINHSEIPFDPPLRVMEIKTKISKWDLIKFNCTVKGKNRQDEKTTLRMVENNCEPNNLTVGLTCKIFKQLT